MSTATILPVVKVEDVPAKEAKPFKTIGVVGENIELKEIANGYVRVSVPINFTTEAGTDSTFYANWNVRPEWFTPQYAQQIKAGQVTGSEKTQYDINMSGLTRGLFASAGLTDLNFELLPGSQVGFKTKPRKDDPSRLDISYFFSPSKLKN